MDHVPEPQQIAEIDDPRLRLTVAGAHVLRSQGFAVLAAGLSPERVAKAAGRSRRVFYDHFETKEDLLRAIADLYFDTTAHQVIAGAKDTDIEALLELAAGDLFDSVRRLAELGFANVLTSDADLIQIAVTALALGDAEVSETVETYYRELDAATMRIGDVILNHWGLQLRPPWTRERFAAVVHALGEGLYLRSRFEPDLADLELFELTLLTLMPIIGVPSGSQPPSIRQHLRRYSEEMSSAWREHTDTASIENAHERVVAAFRSELRDSGLADLGLGTVAARAGLSTALVTRSYTSVERLLRTTVEDALPSFTSEAAFDIAAAELTLGQILERHLRRIGEWIIDHRELCRAVTACAAMGDNPDGMLLARDLLDALSGPAEAILREGVKRNEIAPDIDLPAIASMTAELMVTRCGTFMLTELEPTVAFVARAVLQGSRRRYGE